MSTNVFLTLCRSHMCMRHPRFTLAVRGQVIPEPVCSHHLAGRVAELSTNGCRVVNVATIPDPEEEPCPD